MTGIVAATANASRLLSFIGLITILGVSWSVWDRIAIGLGLVIAFAAQVALDERKPRPAPARRPRYEPAA